MKTLTLQQFRVACAVVDADFNVSRAATQLFTTQSAVSKTIKSLEDELGAAVFARASVRITGVTDYGHEFVGIARGILRDAHSVVERAQKEIKRTCGLLRIGATHVHAMYALPKVIHSFRAKYPEISVQLEQADANEVAQWVSSRRVQMGIAESAGEAQPGLITLSATKLERCIVVPVGHELLRIGMPTLGDLARYPIIMHPEHHPAGRRVRALFQHHGITPTIALSGPDTTVLKEYVAAGLGIAILHKIAIQPEDQCKIAAIDASHLITSTQSQILLRPGEYLHTYVYDFAETFSPQWCRKSLMSEIERQNATAAVKGEPLLH